MSITIDNSTNTEALSDITITKLSDDESYKLGVKAD